MSELNPKTDRIHYLNDLARSQPIIANTTWVMTGGVSRLLLGDLDPGHPDALARATQLRRTIALYADWGPGNDPYGEHDFGAFDLFGERLLFKIDYYHPDHDSHAPDPASVELCRRVLTVMLADEY